MVNLNRFGREMAEASVASCVGVVGVVEKLQLLVVVVVGKETLWHLIGHQKYSCDVVEINYYDIRVVEIYVVDVVFENVGELRAVNRLVWCLH